MRALLLVASMLLAGCAMEPVEPGPSPTTAADPPVPSPSPPAPSPVAPRGGVVFSESWESGMGAWDEDGEVGNVVCGAGRTGCALRIDPACCGSPHRKLLAFPDAPLDRPLSFSFWFQGSDTAGDMDVVLQTHFSPQAVNLGLNNGLANNGVSVTSTLDYHDRAFGEWQEANVWYQVELRLDPRTSTAQARLFDADGNLLSMSPFEPIPDRADLEVENFGFHATRWNAADRTTMLVDDIVVAYEDGS